MDFRYTSLQQDFSREIINFAKAELNSGVGQRDKEQVFPVDLWTKCGQMGIQGLPIPEDYGGLGLNALSTAVALEAFGYGCEDGGLVFAICAHMLACALPVWKFGNEEQKRKYLPYLASGKMIATNGMTESTSGSDAFRMSATAVRDGNGFRLNGRKMFASNGPVADLALVYASTDPEKGFFGGTTAFLVERGTPGFMSGQAFEQMGLRTCKIGELVFDDAYVDDSTVLGGVGAGSSIFTNSMAWERTCIGATHVGSMQRILEKVVDYARTREASGRTLGGHQAVAHKIADMKVRLEASRWLAMKAAWSLDQTKHSSLDPSILKIHASEALIETAKEALHIFGGYGYMTEYGLERTLRDSIASTLYSGTTEVQRNIIAVSLGLKS